MRYHSNTNTNICSNQETITERADRQRRQRIAELKYSGSDEERWSINRKKVLKRRATHNLENNRVKAKLHPVKDEQSVFEYVVSSATKRIIYPGVIQCITITGVVPNIGIIGAHISPGATKSEIEATFDILNTGGSAGCLSWYVMGNFEQHFKYNKFGWKSEKKVLKYISSKLGKNARYFSFDIGTIAKDCCHTWGTDILVELNADEIYFSEKKSASRVDKSEFKLIKSDFVEFESEVIRCF
ncbi:hypothetical protein [Vibrio hyugaensis]|uniref:hypothetical protein n=1 Tax=Vibrio hyugaensis TaxID=1534743 RepID=UPI000CE3C479|nr:hypothetical protein [Vibrio hyugaensis]